jgi:hypothetical protein
MKLFLPVTLSSTIFLRFLGISIDRARLGEVAGEMLLGSGGTISKTSVVTVILLMGAGH